MKRLVINQLRLNRVKIPHFFPFFAAAFAGPATLARTGCFGSSAAVLDKRTFCAGATIENF